VLSADSARSGGRRTRRRIVTTTLTVIREDEGDPTLALEAPAALEEEEGGEAGDATGLPPAAGSAEGAEPAAVEEAPPRTLRRCVGGGVVWVGA